MSFHFLSKEDVLLIHKAETKLARHDSNIRDMNLLVSAIENTKLICVNGYVTDLFDLAVAYIKSITMNHPFIDGNKRTALATAIIFLEINGVIINENYEVELADKVLALIEKKLSAKDFSLYLRTNCHNM